MGFLTVLSELIGEAIHIILINASFIGAYVSFFCERVIIRRNKKK